MKQSAPLLLGSHLTSETLPSIEANPPHHPPGGLAYFDVSIEALVAGATA